MSKRFTTDEGLEDVLCWEINDKENEDMTCGECVELLNELAEENQDLHKKEVELGQNYLRLLEENEQLKSSDTITDLETEIMKLKQEKEQLKKDVEYWKQVASQYSNELNVFEHCKNYKTECKDIHWSSD